MPNQENCQIQAADLGTVLIVHNDPISRNRIAQTLTNEGYIVLDSASGREAVTLANSFPGRIDLVVLQDIFQRNPLSLTLAEITKAKPAAKFIFVSVAREFRVNSANHLYSADEAGTGKSIATEIILAKVRDALKSGEPEQV